MKNPNHSVFISYHAPALFDRATECARNRQGVATIILCISSIEALIHDLTEWYKVAIDHNESCPNQRKKHADKENFFKAEYAICFSELHFITDKESSACFKLQELEQSHSQLEKKVAELFNTFQDKSPPKGDKAWQEFVFLTQLRNEIIHVKGEKLTHAHSYDPKEKEAIDGYPNFIKCLEKRGLIYLPEYLNKGSSWLELIEKNEKLLTWCITTTNNYSKIITGILPDSNMSQLFKKEIEF